MYKRQTTLITVHHEKELREAAENNSKMVWLNVKMLGLQGKPHPILQDVTTPHEVRQMRYQVKMLCGDLYTYSLRAQQSGGSPHCRLCQAPYEDLPHVLSTCTETNGPRQVQSEALRTILVNSQSVDENITLTKSITIQEYLDLVRDEDLLTQFVVDPTSYNLPSTYRVSIEDKNARAVHVVSPVVWTLVLPPEPCL